MRWHSDPVIFVMQPSPLKELLSELINIYATKFDFWVQENVIDGNLICTQPGNTKTPVSEFIEKCLEMGEKHNFSCL